MRPRFLLPLLLLLAAGCSYGPVVDRSGVSSAVLLPGGEGVGFVYRVLRYRPAQGVAAFPDGGVPRYLDDRVVVAVAPRQGGAMLRLDTDVSDPGATGLSPQAKPPECAGAVLTSGWSGPAPAEPANDPVGHRCRGAGDLRWRHAARLASGAV